MQNGGRPAMRQSGLLEINNGTAAFLIHHRKHSALDGADQVAANIGKLPEVIG